MKEEGVGRSMNDDLGGFLRRGACACDQRAQGFTVFIRKLYKADAHAESGVLLIHAIGIGPDHFATDPYGVMFAGKNRHAIGFVESQRLLAKDKQPIHGDVSYFSLDRPSFSQDSDGPTHFHSWSLAFFYATSQVRSS